MNSTTPDGNWPHVSFTRSEWELVTTTWDRLVEECKVVRGRKPTIMKNFEALIRGLKASDDDLKRHLQQPLKASCKKYKALHYYISKKSKMANADESSETSQQSFQNQTGLTDEQILFGEQPSIHQSQLHSSLVDSPEVDKGQQTPTLNISSDTKQIGDTTMQDIREFLANDVPPIQPQS